VLRSSKLLELAFTPGKLAWPWVAFSPERGAFAATVSPGELTVRSSASLDRETRLRLPDVLSVPTEEPSRSGTTSRQPGIHAIAVHPDARSVVAFGWHADIPVACILQAGLQPELVDLGPALGDMGPLAATFTREGQSLWVSAESHSGAAIARLRFRDFALESKAAFPPPPPPASHEIFLHPTEDAVLLAMACGPDGTFVRVARAAGGRLDLVEGEGDRGLEPCGVAEATDDGTRVCLVTCNSVELRRWPDLARESAFELGEELSANYNGVRLGGRFIVSATREDDDGDGDANERALVFGSTLELEDDAPAPPGMWAGRLGRDRLVTVGRGKGESRAAFVHAIEV
jgi:hypothetical protein